ncbi:unnamed protein product [Colias eurytheme]|nr:unnamed protein product [Colias eurytheme]
MTCPFRRASSQLQFANGGARKPEFRSRQSSVHLPTEEEDGEKNTLTLKHLSEALKLLTAPTTFSCYILDENLHRLDSKSLLQNDLNSHQPQNKVCQIPSHKVPQLNSDLVEAIN